MEVPYTLCHSCLKLIVKKLLCVHEVEGQLSHLLAKALLGLDVPLVAGVVNTEAALLA